MKHLLALTLFLFAALSASAADAQWVRLNIGGGVMSAPLSGMKGATLASTDPLPYYRVEIQRGQNVRIMPEFVYEKAGESPRSEAGLASRPDQSDGWEFINVTIPTLMLPIDIEAAVWRIGQELSFGAPRLHGGTLNRTLNAGESYHMTSTGTRVRMSFPVPVVRPSGTDSYSRAGFFIQTEKRPYTATMNESADQLLVLETSMTAYGLYYDIAKYFPKSGFFADTSLHLGYGSLRLRYDPPAQEKDFDSLDALLFINFTAGGGWQYKTDRFAFRIGARYDMRSLSPLGYQSDSNPNSIDLDTVEHYRAYSDFSILF